MSANAFKEKVESYYGISLSSNPSKWIKINKGDGGYVSSVTIDGQITVKGNDLRFCLGLKSPKFAYSFG
jgi:hypothetical protein